MFIDFIQIQPVNAYVTLVTWLLMDSADLVVIKSVKCIQCLTIKHANANVMKGMN